MRIYRFNAAYAASVELRFQYNYNTHDPYLWLLLTSLALRPYIDNEAALCVEIVD